MIRRPPGIEMALLGFLRDGPVHGYQLYPTVTDPNGLGIIWQLKQSQLYALLSKLEHRGYIAASVEPQEPARPPRKMFHLTPAGQEAYQGWLKSPVKAHHQMRQEFMAKLFFAHREGSAYVHALVHAQRAACQYWLESLSAETPAPSSFEWLLRQYRIGQIRAELAWLENDFPEG